MDIRYSFDPRNRAWAAVEMLEVEIGQALPDVQAPGFETQGAPVSAFSLVELHGRPVGGIHLSLDQAGLSPDAYARAIWSSLSCEINEHLLADGLPIAADLTAEGFPGLCPHLCPIGCIEERRRLFRQAPLVSMILTVHEQPQELDERLKSLLSVDYPNWEVLIVDSAPETEAVAQHYQRRYKVLPTVHYLREMAPGRAQARRRGLSESNGEIVVFVDEGARPHPYWLTGLVQALTGRVAAATGPILNAFPALDSAVAADSVFCREVYDLRLSDLTRLFDDGANWTPPAPIAYRASLLRAAAGLDGHAHAAARRDLQLVYEPTAVVWHD